MQSPPAVPGRHVQPPARSIDDLLAADIGEVFLDFAAADRPGLLLIKIRAMAAGKRGALGRRMVRVGVARVVAGVDVESGVGGARVFVGEAWIPGIGRRDERISGIHSDDAEARAKAQRWWSKAGAEP